MPKLKRNLRQSADGATGLRALILAFYLPALMATLGQGLLVPILPLYAADFEIGYVLIGLILAGEGLGTLIADVPTGLLQRRFGNKQMMMMGLLLKSVTILLLFAAPTIWAVLLLRLFAGFGRSMYTVSAHVYVTNHVALGQRGKAISMYGGTHRLGGFIGPAIGGFAALVFGLRAAFLIGGLVTALGFVLVALFTRGQREEKRKTGAREEHPLHLLVRTAIQLPRAGVGGHCASIRADDSRRAHRCHSLVCRRCPGPRR